MADVPTISTTYNTINSAGATLAGLAFGGTDLAVWRERQGIVNDDLEQAARESARDTVEEIETAIENGQEFTTEQLVEYLVREYEAAFQIGWVCHERVERKRRSQDDEQGVEA